MKKVALLLSVMLVTLVSCHSGPLSDIRIGKTYGVFAADEILFQTAPSPDAETFTLDKAQSFYVEDYACRDGMSKPGCFFEMSIALEDPKMFEVMYFMVKFESSREGYINARYFLPELHGSMVSDKLAARMGMTASDYAVKARRMYVDEKEILRRAGREGG